MARRFKHYRRAYGKGNVCDVCGRDLVAYSGDAYVVPNAIFYSSEQYRKFFRENNALSAAAFKENMPSIEDVDVGMLSDIVLWNMQNSDKSKGAAVCDDCIYMFGGAERESRVFDFVTQKLLVFDDAMKKIRATFFKRKTKPEPKRITGTTQLTERRLETAAIEYAISRSSSCLVDCAFGGRIHELNALNAFMEDAEKRMFSCAKNPQERSLVTERAKYLITQMEVDPLERKILYVRFDIEKLGAGYGDAAFKVLFHTVSIRRLCGCELFFGDTRRAEEYRAVCAIGLCASRPQLEFIQRLLSKSLEFKKVCAPTPLILADEIPRRNMSEPLVHMGVAMFDCVKNNSKNGFDIAVSVYNKMKAQREV